MAKKIRPKRLHADSKRNAIIVEYIVENHNEDVAGEVSFFQLLVQPH